MGTKGRNETGSITRARLSTRRRGLAAVAGRKPARPAQNKAELQLVREEFEQPSAEQDRVRARQLVFKLGFQLNAKLNPANASKVDTQWEASSQLRESMPDLPRYSVVYAEPEDAVRNALSMFHAELGKLLGTMVALVLLLTMSACDGGGFGIRWFLSQPFAVRVGEGVPFLQDEVTRSLREGIEQFGGTVNEAPAKQTIVVEFDPECSCPTCTNNAIKSNQTAAYVAQRSYDRIEVCPQSELAIGELGQARAADLILKHELGHVLGLVTHQPDGLMQAVVNDRLMIRSFQPSDIAAICQTGRIVSTTCQAAK